MESVVIFSFMIKDLKLKGSELLIYALIYFFSQYGHTCYMKPETMSKSLGISRSQVFRSLSSLTRKGFISYNGLGFIATSNELTDTRYLEEYQEMVRIAKTRWLD